MKRIDSDFVSRRLRCSAWLFLPEGSEKPPVIVMAHGLSGQKDFGRQNYAGYFANHNMAALVFDYRNYGCSEGEPRNLANPWRQLEGGHFPCAKPRWCRWQQARPVGHVVATAAQVMGAQVLFVDGMSSTLQFPVSCQVQSLFLGIRDLARMIRGKAPHTVPAVGEPGRFALMNNPECMPGCYALVPEDTTCKNEVPARFIVMISAYRPTGYARKVDCPMLVMYAKKDTLILHKTVKKMGRKIPRAEVVGLDVGHFDVYTGELFNQVVERQAGFLKKNLDA